MQHIFLPEKAVKSGQYFYDFKEIRDMARKSKEKEDFSIFNPDNKSLLN